MKKTIILLIALMVISVSFLSGCNEWQSTEAENKSPTVSCSANPTSGTVPLTVEFTGLGNDPDGEIESYSWDFGDGEQSSLQNPTHTFQNSGTYTVTLTVTDNKEETATDSIQIIVSKLQNEQPTASASASTTSGPSPLTVSFTGFGTDLDGYIISYHWDFGDGYTSNEQNPSHTFLNEGTYTVTLTVTDNEGAIGIDTIIINVQFPEPIILSQHVISGEGGGYTKIYGKLKNIGSNNIKDLQVIVTLYDTSNNIIESIEIGNTNSQFLCPPIVPAGEIADFFVEFGYVSYYDHYDIEILSYKSTDEEPFELSIIEHYIWYYEMMGDTYVRGTIKNTGTIIANNVRIWGIFYDSDGDVIWCDINSYTGPVRPHTIEELFSGQEYQFYIPYPSSASSYDLVINYGI